MFYMIRYGHNITQRYNNIAKFTITVFIILRVITKITCACQIFIVNLINLLYLYSKIVFIKYLIII